MASSKLLRGGVSIASLLGMGMLSLSSASAQAPAAPAAPRGAVEATEADIVITGTKRSAGELAQDAPVAVTAFNADQLDALNFQTLQSLSYTMPNTSLEDVGTAPGVANFSIRGLGTNSSIPSVDPTVGVFVDGVYMGLQAGGVFDSFDLEGVEVLRGPQGVLFGRNVTGGAIMVRTRAPTDYYDVRGGISLETGNRWQFDGTMSGPIIGDVLTGKIGWMHIDDDGWFKNLNDGSQFGKEKNDVFRAALRLTPTDDLDFTLRLQQTQDRAPGPAAQNHALFSRDSFDFSIDNPGFTNTDQRSVTLEGNWNVGFGTITNIFGWSDFEALTAGDIDATPLNVFSSRSVTAQDQVSNELRFNGKFGALELTTGAYYFQQDLLYIEERTGLAFGSGRTGGGNGDFDTQGVFVAGDWSLTDTITLNAGVRYTEENKKAMVSRIRRVGDSVDGGAAIAVPGGSIDNRTLLLYPGDPTFDLSWNDTSPRVGIQWEPDSDTQFYASASKGFRSGGVNFRHTTLGTLGTPRPPVPFDAEEQTAFEVGMKKDFLDRRARLNVALFHSKVEKLQREINLAEAATGVSQYIVNAGDAIFQGAELEGRFSILDNLLVTAQVGYTDASYDTVTADLDNDGSIGASDLDQEIPRVAPWTYGVSLINDLELGSFGLLSSRVSYNHRDESAYNDTNDGRLNKADLVDLNFTFKPEAFSNLEFSLYGNNVTDETTFGGDTVLPDVGAFGGDGGGPKPKPTFSPLNKGRVWGAEIRARF